MFPGDLECKWWWWKGKKSVKLKQKQPKQNTKTLDSREEKTSRDQRMLT